MDFAAIFQDQLETVRTLCWNWIYFAQIFSRTEYCFQGKILEQVKSFFGAHTPVQKKSSTPPARDQSPAIVRFFQGKDHRESRLIVETYKDREFVSEIFFEGILPHLNPAYIFILKEYLNFKCKQNLFYFIFSSFEGCGQQNIPGSASFFNHIFGLLF